VPDNRKCPFFLASLEFRVVLESHEFRSFQVKIERPIKMGKGFLTLTKRVILLPSPFVRRMSDEVVKAVEAAKFKDDSPGTIFDKIVAGLIPSSVVYQDNLSFAFRDISPQAPVHVLVIPKERSGLTRLTKATPEHKFLLGHLMWVASEVARMEGLSEEGCRFVINDGPAGAQSVYHLHIHVLGGRQLRWPPG
jgi:histidine triad (HIT) family protein